MIKHKFLALATSGKAFAWYGKEIPSPIARAVWDFVDCPACLAHARKMNINVKPRPRRLERTDGNA